MNEYIINSFSSGELTPRAAGRTDVKVYKNGADTILNGILLPQGGITRKPGSYMLETLTTGSYLVEFEGSDGIGYLFVFQDFKLYIYLNGVEIASSDLTTVHSLADLANIQYAIDENVMYIVDGANIPQLITYTPSSTTFAVSDYASTAVQPTWDMGTDNGYSGDFESTDNFPHCITFYEGRLIFGNTDNFPSYIWGSNVKDYVNFTETSPSLVATDGFELKINAKRGPKVLWLLGSRGLFVGTSNGPFSISDENSLLSPVSLISAKQNSSYPANNTPGFILGGEMFYVQAGERKIRLAVFNKEQDIYNTPDVTSAAEHITIGRIKKAVTQFLPETYVWVLLEDGSIIVFSYNKENAVAGWTRLSTTGLYKDIEVIREGNSETVYIIADRDGIEHLEKFNPIDFENKEYMYLDSALTQTFGAQLTITSIETVLGRLKVTTSVAHSLDATNYIGVSGTGIVGVDDVIFKVGIDTTTTFFLLDEILESDSTVVVSPAVTIGAVSKADNVITGLSHLEGNEVNIVSGPVNIGTDTVASGVVSTSRRRTTFTVGLNFYTDIIPMNIAESKSRKKNLKHIAVEFYKTIAPKGGSDSDNLDFFRYRRDIVMNNPQDMYTGIAEIPVRGGSSYAGKMMIRQSLPLPMTVLSITAEVEVY